MLYVMSLAHSGWAIAAGRHAMAVADDKRLPQGRRDDLGCAADVDDLGATVGDHAGDVAVACQPFQRGPRQVSGVRSLAPNVGDKLGSAIFELGDVDNRGEVRAHAARAAERTRVERAPAHVHQRISAALRTRARLPAQ